MIKIILITICIYSLILTIFTIYKDSSSYYMVETLDIIMAGPTCWLLVLLTYILKSILKITSLNKYFKNSSTKLYKKKSIKYISKVVAKIMKNYIVVVKKRKYNELFDFSFRQGEFNCNDIEGWGRLLVNKPINERINNKFNILMYNQKEETIKELLKYFDIVTRDMLENNKYNKYFIDDIMNRKNPTYILKQSFIAQYEVLK